MKFKNRKGFNIPYEMQGLIFFSSLNYKRVDDDLKQAIRKACFSAGGEYDKALFEAVTTSKPLEVVALNHYTSTSVLYRRVQGYYIEMARYFRGI